MQLVEIFMIICPLAALDVAGLIQLEHVQILSEFIPEKEVLVKQRWFSFSLFLEIPFSFFSLNLSNSLKIIKIKLKL